MKSSKATATGPQLAKLIKRQILGKPQTAVIRFPKGFGAECLAEAEAILGELRVDAAASPILTLQPTGVDLAGISFRTLLALTSRLTTAREVLWSVGRGRCGSVGDLKDRWRSVPWALFLKPGTTLALRVESTASHVFHEGKIGEVLSRLFAESGITVTPRAESQHLLDVRLFEDRVNFSLSLAGRPLYQRRYKRVLQGTASVKEDVAAAALRFTLRFASQQAARPFTPSVIVVPFAGSGTFGFEASITLRGIPPALFFGELSATAFPCTPDTTLPFVLKASLAQVPLRPNPPVIMIELDAQQAALLQTNCDHFNERLIASGIEASPFSVVNADALAAQNGPGHPHQLVLLNPPFGERLGVKADTVGVYQRIARGLTECTTETAGFIFAPSRMGASRFIRALQGFATVVQPFGHGGRTVYLVSFYLNKNR